MPDWINYYMGYTPGTSADSSWGTLYSGSSNVALGCETGYASNPPTPEEIKRAEELAEDKERYPLFFWRETCA